MKTYRYTRKDLVEKLKSKISYNKEPWMKHFAEDIIAIKDIGRVVSDCCNASFSDNDHWIQCDRCGDACNVVTLYTCPDCGKKHTEQHHPPYCQGCISAITL